MFEEDRRAAQTKADTEYNARELAALRLAIGEVPTRDYLRHELDSLRALLAELQPSDPDVRCSRGWPTGGAAQEWGAITESAIAPLP